jgi:GT2 family glycosyltransferase
VVVVSHDAEAYLGRCLDALAATEGGHELDVVVVDNASTDASAEVAAARGARVLRSSENLGFGPACNRALSDLGIRQRVEGEPDLVALVNPDAFVEPGWLQPLVDALRADPGLGAAVPKIVFADRPSVVNSTGTVLDRHLNGSDRGAGDPDDGRWDTPGEVWGWGGAAVLLCTAYLHDVGLFDERLFLYYEDVDLSWRGRARGWRYAYVPAARVHHGRGWATSERAELFEVQNRRNRLVVATKHAPWLAVVGVWLWCLGGFVVLAVRETGRGWVRTRRYARALREAGALIPTVVRERRRSVDV